MSGGDSGWETLFWLVFEQSANPISLLDSERRFVEVNAPVVEWLRTTRGHLIGRPITDVIVPGERADSWAAWREFLRRGEYSGERTFIRGDGTHLRTDFAARMATVGGRRLAVYVTSQAFEAGRFTRPGEPDAQALTPREREIVTLIAFGHDTTGIADELSISQETVRTHVRNAMRKLDVHTRAQLVAVCLSHESAPHLPHMR